MDDADPELAPGDSLVLDPFRGESAYIIILRKSTPSGGREEKKTTNNYPFIQKTDGATN